MKIDLKKFRELVDQKYLSVQQHPNVDLLVWNYTHRCQFSRFWTEETIMARGLITDLEGNIKARPFKKFFNLSEHIGEDSKLPALPVEAFEVTDKMDGSLGILYWQGDNPYLATRGSFVSEQAIKGTQILHNKYLHIKFNPDYTYLFEIVYPANKIVVDYGGLEDIVLLAQVHTESGEEVSCWDYADVLPVVKKYDGIADLSSLQSLAEDNREGFVVKFKSGARIKVKFEEYVRLHRLVTGVNAKRIWEHLKNNEPLDELLERVPDEFYKWVNQTVTDLKEDFAGIKLLAGDLYKTVEGLPTRKEQALTVQGNKLGGIVFKMLDDKDPAELIWKMVRPVAEKPFREDIDL